MVSTGWYWNSTGTCALISCLFQLENLYCLFLVTCMLVNTEVFGRETYLTKVKWEDHDDFQDGQSLCLSLIHVQHAELGRVTRENFARCFLIRTNVVKLEPEPDFFYDYEWETFTAKKGWIIWMHCFFFWDLNSMQFQRWNSRTSK